MGIQVARKIKGVQKIKGVVRNADESSNDQVNITVNFVRDIDSCFLSLLKDLDDSDIVNIMVKQVSNENEVHSSLVMPSISTPSKL